jgi:hypothetical protein
MDGRHVWTAFVSFGCKDGHWLKANAGIVNQESEIFDLGIWDEQLEALL